MPRDLETIVHKAIAREPVHRYQTATELAEDLTRFLDDRPIRARRASARERLWRWCRRNPASASLLGLVAALLVIVAVGSSVAAVWLRDERDGAVTAKDAAERAEHARREQLVNAYLAQAKAERLTGRVGQRFESLIAVREATAIARELNLPPARFDALRTEAIAALALPDIRVDRDIPFPAGSFAADFDDKLERYARTDRQGGVSIRLVVDNSEIARLPGFGVNLEAWPYLSPDGRSVLVQCQDGRIRVWKLDGPKPVGVVSLPAGYHAFGFSVDGKRTLISVATEKSLQLIDLRSGAVRRLPQAMPVHTLAFHPDGRQAALATSANGQPVVQVRDLDTGTVTATLPHPASVIGLAWSPDGQMLVCHCYNSKLYSWDLVTRRRLELAGHSMYNTRLAFNHAGDLLAGTGSDDGTVRLWDPYSGRLVFHSKPHGGWRPHFSPDDRLLAGTGGGGKLRLLEVAAGREYRTLESDPALRKGDYYQAAITSTGRLLAVAMSDGLRLWDLGGGQELAHLRLGRTFGALFDKSGALLTNGPLGLLRWPLQTDPASPDTWRLGPPQALLRPSSHNTIAQSGNRGVLAVPFNDEGGLVLDLNRRPNKQIWLRPQRDVRYVAISPDGRWAATGTHIGTDHTVKVWKARNGKLEKELPVDLASNVGFSSDGRWLATTGLGGCRLWAVGTWRPGPRVGGVAFAFSPDSRLFAVETGAGVIRLVDPATGREYARLEDPHQDEGQPTFSPDGTRLVVTNNRNHSVHIWDLRLIRKGLKALDLD